MMNYKDTVKWMYNRLPMYQNKGTSALNYKLDNIRSFCTYLGHVHHSFKSIHVAGTNGKGSSCHMLASIYQSAGYRVGIYTSPHLIDFRERIKINGKMLSKQFVKLFISNHQKHIVSHKLSFFELTVAMAFAYFSSKKVDLAIIEAGLGGRLDSTNIITPLLSLITNISMDHTNILGDTIESIAFEKAGIIKPKIPVVVSEFQEQAHKVFKAVSIKNETTLSYPSQTKNYPLEPQGTIQIKNMKGVLEAVQQLQKKIKVSQKSISKGLSKVYSNTKLMGRWQLIHKNPLVVLDIAHNKAALQHVLDEIKKIKYEKLKFVMGFVKEKAINDMLVLLPQKAKYYFSAPKLERAFPTLELAELAKNNQLDYETYDTVQSAYQSAKKEASVKDLIVVCGSNFVVSEVLLLKNI